MTESTDESEPDTGEETADSADVNAERDRIIKENQRKLDEYQENRKKAEDKVKAPESAGITVARNLGRLGETMKEVMDEAQA